MASTTYARWSIKRITTLAGSQHSTYKSQTIKRYFFPCNYSPSSSSLALHRTCVYWTHIGFSMKLYFIRWMTVTKRHRLVFCAACGAGELSYTSNCMIAVCRMDDWMWKWLDDKFSAISFNQLNGEYFRIVYWLWRTLLSDADDLKLRIGCCLI